MGRVSKKTMEKEQKTNTKRKDDRKLGGGTGSTAALFQRAAKKVGTVTKATAKEVKATAKEVGLGVNTNKSNKNDATSPVPDPNTTTIGHPDSIYNDTSSDDSYDDYDDKEKKKKEEKASSSRSFRIKKEKRVSKKTMEKEQKTNTKKKDDRKLGGGTGSTAALFQRAAKKVGT